MSLYGALFAGVSALSAQSQSIGMISDNIANVNTAGYKRTEASFSTLVTRQGKSTAYAPGAVKANTLARIDQQGILQQSKSSTDIAISGSGFFVVKSSINDGLQEPLYTRAGGFSEDSQGYLVNAAGKYLFGWPLDQDGNVPASSGDISSMVPVDVGLMNSVTRPTTRAEAAINLNAKEAPYTYPLSGTEQANYPRGFKVYDSLGAGHDITMKFYKIASPTATMTGTTDIKNYTDLFNNISSIGATATATSTVTIGTNLGTTSAALNDGDTFVIKMDGETATITVTESMTPTQFAAAINAAFSGTPATNTSGVISLTASTPIEIKQGGSQPMSAAVLNDLGLSYGTTMRSPKTFTLQVGTATVQTVTINDGDSSADLVNKINALDGISAMFDASNHMIVSADTAGQDLIVGGVGGSAPEISTAGFSALGFSESTFNPPVSPTLLVEQDDVPLPQNWWHMQFVSEDGTIMNEGAINFRGDGSLNAQDDPATLNLASIDWGNGSDAQDISVDVSALTQYSGSYNVSFLEQNGAELGLRTGIAIDRDGTVVARFSNGETASLYKLPLATFANVNGLIGLNGNVFQQSTESGEYNLREAGTGSAGVIESSALEASNVDLADEFSKMIVTQRAYSAGTKVITTTDDMLDELLRLRR
jgi:flagellar hook protein FlgE